MMLTCDIDEDCGEGGQRNGGDVLGADPQDEVLGGFIVQRLSHQDRRWPVLSVWGQVEPNGHVGLRNHPVLQVVGNSGISKQGCGFDGLFRTKMEEDVWGSGLMSSNTSFFFCIFIYLFIQSIMFA